MVTKTTVLVRSPFFYGIEGRREEMTTLEIIRELIAENMAELADMARDQEGRRAILEMILLIVVLTICIISMGGEIL